MTSKSYILLTFVLALFLTILPLPIWAVWIRPLWVALVLIYWVVATPSQVGLIIAWIMGFSLDILNGTLIGEHALALTVAAYLAARLQRRFLSVPFFVQIWYVLISVMSYQLIIFVIQGTSGRPVTDQRFWLAPLITVLLWPWIATLLRKGQQFYAASTI